MPKRIDAIRHFVLGFFNRQDNTTQPAPYKRPAAPQFIASLDSILQSWTGGKYSGALKSYPTATTLNHVELRKRSRNARWDSTQAAAMRQRLTESVVNVGLSLESTPLWDICSPSSSQEFRKSWTRSVEQRYKIYQSSKQASYDERRNGWQLQRDFFSYRFVDGECFHYYRYSPDTWRLSPLSVQFYNPDQIYSPLDRKWYDAAKSRGNKICDGIEYDKQGREVAFYVHDVETGDCTRIPARGPKSGRTFMVHSFTPEFPGQTRGIPEISGLIHELSKLTDYSLLELQAAVINALFAVWIEPSENANASKVFKQVALKSDEREDTTDDVRQAPPVQAQFDRGGIIIQNLKAGEKVHSYDTGRPNVNFGAYLDAVMHQLSSSLGIPYEVLKQQFGANYSASRASIELFWNNVIVRRDDLEADYLDGQYEAWLTCEIEAGRIQAPGFDIPVIREAWLWNRWIGISKPQIDPLKEVNAMAAAVAEGFSTREFQSQNYNGTSFDDNVARLTEENAQLREANPAPVAQQVAPQPDEDTDTTDEEDNA